MPPLKSMALALGVVLLIANLFGLIRHLAEHYYGCAAIQAELDRLHNQWSVP